MSVIPCTFINVGVWNIHGLTVKINNYKLNKLEDPEYLNRLNTFEILCLQETLCGPTDTHALSVPGYCIIPIHRTQSANSRFFGGSLLLIKRGIRKGIKIIDTASGDKIWIMLKKDFFNFKNDMFFSFTYAPPATSAYTKTLDCET